MEKSTGNSAELQIVAFHLGLTEYALPIDNVQEIIRLQTITRVPRAPLWVEGVINLRGTVVTVGNLHKRFSLPLIQVTEDSRIIIVKLAETNAGILVDDASDVIRISQGAVESSPDITGNIDKEYITGVVKIDNRILILLEPQKLLATGG
ncbi:MAG: chemotaxis protein CheW [Clostridia bacterium]|nr:chemotaxis protein CheW [Clostridia bacterium]